MNDPPTPCAADGPISPTDSILEAVECDTARYVALAPTATDVNRTYVILTRTNDDGTTISFSDVADIPELRNALAHFGPQTQSVRVLTHPGRRQPLASSLDEMAADDSRAFEFSGEGFRLAVRVG
jgi:hypothetical protein